MADGVPQAAASVFLDERFQETTGPSPLTINSRYAIRSKEGHVRVICFELEHGAFTKSATHPANNLLYEYLLSTNRPCSESVLVLKFKPSASLEHDDKRVESILRGGLLFPDPNGATLYSALGCSNSQLRVRTFIFLRGSPEEACALWSELLQNEQPKISKRFKYRGLLLSGCQQIVKLPTSVCVLTEADYVVGGFNFTDGCGLISHGLAEYLRGECKLAFVPSVWQVRYVGHGYVCKGVLVTDYARDGYVLVFRKSLQKVSTQERADRALSGLLGVLNYPSPGRLAALNTQTCRLLSGHAGTDATLLELQQEHLHIAESALDQPAAALRCCVIAKKLTLFESLVKHMSTTEPHSVPSCFGELVKLRLDLLRGRPDKEGTRLKIPLLNSRLVIGAAFPEACTLKEGECFLRVGPGAGTPLQGYVLVWRSPSYAVGDLRCLKAVALPDDCPAARLKDVLLFSCAGERPDPDKTR